MKRSSLLLVVTVVLAACGAPPESPAPAKKAAAAVEKPPDESHRFPRTDRVKIEIVDNYLLGKGFLPGGNLAEYKRDGKTYQQFLITRTSNAAATSLMVKYKDELRDAKFVAHMGGYFGFDGDQPVLLFTLENFLAGIIGLPEKEADLAARDFAARLR